MSECVIPFSGAISVKSVLENQRREILELLVDRKKRSRDFAYIIALARKRNVPVRYVEREELDGYEKRSGGMILLAKPRMFEPFSLSQGMNCFVSGVQDPYNLGSLCRSLYALGCSRLVLLPYDWSAQEQTIQKASAGAWEKLDVVYAQTDSLLAACQKDQVALIAASRRDAQKLESFHFPETFVLAIGGALRGLPADVEEQADSRLFIGYQRDFKNALDTPSAAAIFAYAWHIQQQHED